MASLDPLNEFSLPASRFGEITASTTSHDIIDCVTLLRVNPIKAVIGVIASSVRGMGNIRSNGTTVEAGSCCHSLELRNGQIEDSFGYLCFVAIAGDHLIAGCDTVSDHSSTGGLPNGASTTPGIASSKQCSLNGLLGTTTTAHPVMASPPFIEMAELDYDQ